ncbi:hypothetical protein BC833DRAFT_620721 [Globomyces pollinis-pini]|nr:hypothetical protein BC833DRAFT_620721 [Globomyces pollinis-pini]KAJ2990536.1 hypothetical protein HDV02_004284 [Globomyces sp. JEL0801]
MFANQLILLLAAVSASPIIERDDGPPSTLIADHPELLAKRDGVAESEKLVKRGISLRDISEEISCGGNSLYAINVPSDVVNMPPQSDPYWVSVFHSYWNFNAAPYVCQNPLPFDFGAPIDPFSPAQAQAICEHCSGAPCQQLIGADLSGDGFIDQNGVVFGYQNGLGDAGRIWQNGQSYNNYGYWGKCFGPKICYVEDVDI